MLRSLLYLSLGLSFLAQAMRCEDIFKKYSSKDNFDSVHIQSLIDDLKKIAVYAIDDVYPSCKIITQIDTQKGIFNILNEWASQYHQSPISSNINKALESYESWKKNKEKQYIFLINKKDNQIKKEYSYWWLVEKRYALLYTPKFLIFSVHNPANDNRSILTNNDGTKIVYQKAGDDEEHFLEMGSCVSKTLISSSYNKRALIFLSAIVACGIVCWKHLR